MRFRSIRVHGFGMLADTGVESLNEGLILLEGANGAGKSTFLGFITAMLFGYATGKGSNKYAETPGGLRGGLANLETLDGRQIRWERTMAQRAVGDLSVLHDGAEVDPVGWLGSATRDLYGSVFAIGIEQLQDGEFQKDRQEAIEAAITGMGVRGLPAAVVTMDKQLKALNAELREVQERVKEASEAAEVAKLRTRRYDETLDEAKSVRDAVVRLRAEYGTSAREAERLSRMSRAWDSWCESEQARQRLSELPHSAGFDDGSLERLRNLRSTERDLRIECERLEKESADEHEHLVALPLDQNLIAAQPDIESLAASLYSVREAEVGLEGRELAVAEAKRVFEHALRQFGPDWDEVRLAAVDTSLMAHAEGANHARARLDLSQERVRLEGILKTRVQERADAETTHRIQAEAAIKAGEAPTMAEVDRRNDELDRLRHLIEQFERAQAAMSRPVVVASGPDRRSQIFGFIIALISFAAGAVWQTYVFALIGIVVGIAVALVLSPRTGVPSTATETGPGDQSKDLEVLREEWSRLAEAEGWKVSTLDDLRAIQIELRSARDMAMAADAEKRRLEDTARQVDRLSRLEDQANADLQEVQQRLALASHEWEAWCTQKGYPAGLEADSLTVFESQIDSARNLRENVSKVTQERDQFETRIRNAKTHLTALRTKLGESDSDGSVPEAIAAIDRRLKVALEAQGKADESQRKLRELSRQLEATQKRLGAIDSGIRELLALAGAQDDAAFQTAFEASREAIEIRHLQDKALNLLTQIAGPGEPFERLVSELAKVEDSEVLRVTAIEAGENAANLAAELRSAEDDEIRLSGTLGELESSADLELALSRRAEAKAELEEVRRRWLEAAVAKVLLTEAKEKFQSQVQESVLDRASYYMRQLTDGVSETIRKEGDDYYVLDRDGTRRSVTQLNRSHAERLLLSVRLGYIDNYCSRREPLPIVLDDILVNFDPPHQILAVRTIADLAKRGQVIYLTCHPSTRVLFEANAENFQVVRLNKWRFEA